MYSYEATVVGDKVPFYLTLSRILFNSVVIMHAQLWEIHVQRLDSCSKLNFSLLWFLEQKVLHTRITSSGESLYGCGKSDFDFVWSRFWCSQSIDMCYRSKYIQLIKGMTNPIFFRCLF